MDLKLGETKILIKAENISRAIECFRKKFDDYESVKSGEVNTIEDVFWEFGYNIFADDTGNIIGIDNVCSDLPDGQKDFFEAIAPYVEDGSYIHLKREDTHWKFIFANGTVRRLDSEIVFYDRTMSYERAMCLLDMIVEHSTAARKTSDAIEYLFRLGFTDDELTDVFNFSKSEVADVVGRIEEAE